MNISQQQIPYYLINGYSYTIMTYGAAGTGKSYTLFGNKHNNNYNNKDNNTTNNNDGDNVDKDVKDSDDNDNDDGIVTKLIHSLFYHLEQNHYIKMNGNNDNDTTRQQQRKRPTEIIVKCSIVEIYHNRIRDLLCESNSNYIDCIGTNDNDTSISSSMFSQSNTNTTTPQSSSHHNQSASSTSNTNNYNTNTRYRLVGCTALSCLSADDVLSIIYKANAKRKATSVSMNMKAPMNHNNDNTSHPPSTNNPSTSYSSNSAMLIQIQLEQRIPSCQHIIHSQLNIYDLLSSSDEIISNKNNETISNPNNTNKNTNTNTYTNTDMNTNTNIFSSSLHVLHKEIQIHGLKQKRLYDMIIKKVEENNKKKTAATKTTNAIEADNDNIDDDINDIIQLCYNTNTNNVIISNDLPILTKVLLSDLIGNNNCYNMILLTSYDTYDSFSSILHTLQFGNDCYQLNILYNYINNNNRIMTKKKDSSSNSNNKVDRIANAFIRPKRNCLPYIAFHDPIGYHQYMTYNYTIKYDRMDYLIRSLTKECIRLRYGKLYNRDLWPIIEKIQSVMSSTTSTSTKDNHHLQYQYQINSSYNQNQNHNNQHNHNHHNNTIIDHIIHHDNEMKIDIQNYQHQIHSLNESYVTLLSNNKRYESDIILLQEENRIMKEQLNQFNNQYITIQNENHILKQQLSNTILNHKISQFREHEAIVYMRQLRRFYYRLLKKHTSDEQQLQQDGGGSGDGDGILSDIMKRIPGAPDLSELIDIDRLMMESGLLEKKEVMKGVGDVSIDPTKVTSHDSMERSKNAVTKQMESKDDQFQQEDGDTIEARQKINETPSGQYCTIRDKVLEEECIKLTKLCKKYQRQLEQERMNVKILKDDKMGVSSVAYEQLKIEKQLQYYQDQMNQKDNDLKVVVWKMNELHMIGKMLKSDKDHRDKHIKHLENEIINDLQIKIHTMNKQKDIIEQQYHNEISSLQQIIYDVSKPIWHESPTLSSASYMKKNNNITTSNDNNKDNDTPEISVPSIPCRLIIPFTLKSNIDHVGDNKFDDDTNRRLHQTKDNVSSSVDDEEPGEWISRLDFSIPEKIVNTVSTQTDMMEWNQYVTSLQAGLVPPTDYNDDNDISSSRRHAFNPSRPSSPHKSNPGMFSPTKKHSPIWSPRRTTIRGGIGPTTSNNTNRSSSMTSMGVPFLDDPNNAFGPSSSSVSSSQPMIDPANTINQFLFMDTDDDDDDNGSNTDDDNNNVNSNTSDNDISDDIEKSNNNVKNFLDNNSVVSKIEEHDEPKIRSMGIDNDHENNDVRHMSNTTMMSSSVVNGNQDTNSGEIAMRIVSAQHVSNSKDTSVTATQQHVEPNVVVLPITPPNESHGDVAAVEASTKILPTKNARDVAVPLHSVEPLRDIPVPTGEMMTRNPLQEDTILAETLSADLPSNRLVPKDAVETEQNTQISNDQEIQVDSSVAMITETDTNNMADPKSVHHNEVSCVNDNNVVSVEQPSISTDVAITDSKEVGIRNEATTTSKDHDNTDSKAIVTEDVPMSTPIILIEKSIASDPKQAVTNDSLHSIATDSKLSSTNDSKHSIPNDSGHENNQKAVVVEADKQKQNRFMSITDKLKKQAERKMKQQEQSSGGASGKTPEWMQVFNRVGAKNAKASVIETLGSAAAKDATRGAFGDNVIKGKNKGHIDERKYVSSKDWKPRKRRGSDSDSDDDTAQTGPGFFGFKGHSRSESSSSSNHDEASRTSDLNDSDHATAASNTFQTNKADTDSDSDSNIQNTSMNQRTAANPIQGKGSDSDSSSSSNARNAKSNSISSKPATPAYAKKKDSDSDSDSDSSDDTLKRRLPVPAPATTLPASIPVNIPAKAPGIVKKPDTDSSGEKVRVRGAAPLPVATPATAPAATLPTTTSVNIPTKTPGIVKKPDSDSDSDSSGENARVRGAAPLSVANIPKPEIVNTAEKPAIAKTKDSGSDSSSDDEKPTRSVAPLNLAVNNSSVKPAISKKEDSDSDSSDDKPVVRSSPPVRALTPPKPSTPPPTQSKSNDSDSDSDSSKDKGRGNVSSTTNQQQNSKPSSSFNERKGHYDSESSAEDKPNAVITPAPIPSLSNAPVKATPNMTKKGSDSDSDSDSSTEARRKKIAPTPEPPSKPPAIVSNAPPARSIKKDSDSDSDSSSESNKKKVPPKPTPSLKPSIVPSAPPARSVKKDSDSDSDSSEDKPKGKIATVSSSAPPKPSTPVVVSRQSSASDSSDDDRVTNKATSNQPKPSVSGPVSQLAKPAAPKKMDSDSDSDSDASAPTKKLPANVTLPKPVATRAPVSEPKDSDTDDSSDDDNNNKKPIARPIATRQAKQVDSDSDDSSDDDAKKVFSPVKGSSTKSDKNDKDDPKTKFSLKTGKSANNDDDVLSPIKTPQSGAKPKFAIVGGKLTKMDGTGSDTKSISTNSLSLGTGSTPSTGKKEKPKAKFVVKDGKLIKIDDDGSSAASPVKTSSPKKGKEDDGGKKPSFSIVDGKLVRTDKEEKDIKKPKKDKEKKEKKDAKEKDKKKEKDAKKKKK